MPISFMLISRPYKICLIIREMHIVSRSAKRGVRLYPGTINYNREIARRFLAGVNV